MDDLKDKLIAWFIQKEAARWVVKALTIAAGFGIAHGLFKHTDSTTWINSNSEVILNALALGISCLLTKVHINGQKAAQAAQAQNTIAAVTTALSTPPPAPQDAAAVAKQIIEGKTPNGLP